MPVPQSTTGPTSTTRIGRVVYLSCVGALGGFLFGYDSAVVNGATEAIQDQFGLDDDVLGIVVAIALIGCAIGVLIGGRLADRYGRRKVALLAAVMFVVSGFGQGLPFGAIDFMGWRLLGGLAIGVASVVSPMYIAEIAPARMRGRLTGLFQFAIAVGIFVTAWANWIILQIAGGSADDYLWGLHAWQWMFLAMIVPATVYGVLTLTIPESPRYLVQIGNYDKATRVIASLGEADPTAKVSDIRDTLDSEHKPRLRDLRGPVFGLVGLAWVGIVVNLFQQLVGINAVIYYSNTTYATVGLGESQAFMTSTITTLVLLVFTGIGIAMVDRVGRKPMLLVGSSGMAVCLAVTSLVFLTAGTCTAQVFATSPVTGCDTSEAIGQPLLTHTSGIVAIVALNLFIAFFAATWGPIAWVLISEMFPNKWRAAGLTLGAMAQWIGNFLVSVTFPGLAEFSIGLAYLIFTVFALLSIWFVVKKVKETKGIELEDMDEYVTEPSPAPAR